MFRTSTQTGLIVRFYERPLLEKKAISSGIKVTACKSHRYDIICGTMTTFLHSVQGSVQ